MRYPICLLLSLFFTFENQAQNQSNYFEYLSKSNLYVESTEPPQQFFFQNLAFKKIIGDTIIDGENFSVIQFQRFYRDNLILDKNTLYEHISKNKYILTDRALNKIHFFNINQDSTENGYIFGWKGTVKNTIKSQDKLNNKLVADFYLMRDTNERVTFNQYLQNVDCYQRGVNFTRLLVGNYSSDFVESASEKRTFKPDWKLKPGDEFETTFYEWEFVPEITDFIKKPHSLIRLAYMRDSLLDDVNLSIMSLSSTNLQTQFTEVKPDLMVYHLDTCWYLTSGQLISKNNQNTFAWLRNVNEKADSVSKQNPYNLEDSFDGQFVVLNYVNKDELNGEKFLVNHFFKSDQPGLFAMYDFLPVPFLVPPSFETQLSYLKTGNIIKGKKYVDEFKQDEPLLTKFKSQNKKLSIDIYFPQSAQIDVILAPFEGNKKIKMLSSLKSNSKGVKHFEWVWDELENQSYYYIYITVKYGNKTRLLHHLFQANLNN